MRVACQAGCDSDDRLNLPKRHDVGYNTLAALLDKRVQHFILREILPQSEVRSRASGSMTRVFSSQKKFSGIEPSLI